MATRRGCERGRHLGVRGGHGHRGAGKGAGRGARRPLPRPRRRPGGARRRTGRGVPPGPQARAPRGGRGRSAATPPPRRTGRRAARSGPRWARPGGAGDRPGRARPAARPGPAAPCREPSRRPGPGMPSTLSTSAFESSTRRRERAGPVAILVGAWCSNGSRGSEDSVEDLIARKKYKRAVEVLRAQFQKGSRDPRLRQQLADVLVLAGRGREAVPVLAGLADEFARAGFAAKAIAVLKRIDKIDPGRADVARKLASLIEAKERRPRERAGERSPGSLPRDRDLPARPRKAPHLHLGPLGCPSLGQRRARASRRGPRAFRRRGASGARLRPRRPRPTRRSRSSRWTTSTSRWTRSCPASRRMGDVVRSPLFSDFSAGELLAVMGGLQLLTFDAGDIIITEGEPGSSLFVVSSGRVKAFVRNPAGRHAQVREMDEGSFFGEISILRGQPPHGHGHGRVAGGPPGARPRHPRRHHGQPPPGARGARGLLPRARGQRRRGAGARHDLRLGRPALRARFGASAA